MSIGQNQVRIPIGALQSLMLLQQHGVVNIGRDNKSAAHGILCDPGSQLGDRLLHRKWIDLKAKQATSGNRAKRGDWRLAKRHG
jgi:hypothetical protein